MSVAKCANPECSAEFRRLGTGKLYVKTLKKAAGPTKLSQKAAWMCNRCVETGLELCFDKKLEAFRVRQKQKKVA